ncbi:diguanylate cyclase [Acidaminobacter sp. JC074]|uniref:sensor domain-containing diguanylate cyclase n=1 Tax=Acidaminobacter sp. JC074 TaxID=2530199 RepID=UPI001F0D82F1|nr:diguanylate cyclase [Acidaminobacter sp. JC074]
MILGFEDEFETKFDELNNKVKSDFGENDYYISIEEIVKTNAIVLDKTGTIKATNVQYLSNTSNLPQYLKNYVDDLIKSDIKSNFYEHTFKFTNKKVILYVGILSNEDIIIMEQDLYFLSEAKDSANKLNVAVSGLLILLGTIISIPLSIHLTRPILQINDLVNEIKDLKFDKKLNISNKDEIGDLANSINFIALKLRTTLDKLDQKNKQLLDEQNLLINLNTQLQHSSETDALTKLSNRLKIDKDLEHCRNNFKNSQKDFSIILLDIDFFKKVNDNYGHLVGDEVLKEFAHILKSNTRETDLVGRWGGEEFIIILQNTPISKAYNKAESIRKIIELYNFDTVNRITVSMGVGSYNSIMDIDQLMSKIDNALYKAKENGRNQVQIIASKTIE